MKIRHDILVRELDTIIGELDEVRKVISNPVTVETTFDGLGPHHTFSESYPGGVPGWLKVQDLEGLDIEELRAEILLAAGKLEVLASL